MSSKEARLSHGDCYPGRGETTENYIAMAQTAKAMVVLVVTSSDYCLSSAEIKSHDGEM